MRIPLVWRVLTGRQGDLREVLVLAAAAVVVAGAVAGDGLGGLVVAIEAVVLGMEAVVDYTTVVPTVCSEVDCIGEPDLEHIVVVDIAGCIVVVYATLLEGTRGSQDHRKGP